MNTGSFVGTSGSPLSSSDLKFAPRIAMFVIAVVLNASDSLSISSIVRGESIANTTSIAEIALFLESTVTSTVTSSPALAS